MPLPKLFQLLILFIFTSFYFLFFYDNLVFFGLSLVFTGIVLTVFSYVYHAIKLCSQKTRYPGLTSKYYLEKILWLIASSMITLFCFVFFYFLFREIEITAFLYRKEWIQFVAKIPRGIGKLDLRPNKTG